MRNALCEMTGGPTDGKDSSWGWRWERPSHVTSQLGNLLLLFLDFFFPSFNLYIFSL